MNLKHFLMFMMWLVVVNYWPLLDYIYPHCNCYVGLLFWFNIPSYYFGFANLFGEQNFALVTDFGFVPITTSAWILTIAFWVLVAWVLNVITWLIIWLFQKPKNIQKIPNGSQGYVIPMPENRIRCPKCGAVMAITDTKCVWCGHQVSSNQ